MKNSITVKILAHSKAEIDEVIAVLESRFLVVATSGCIPSSPNGFHIFLNLLERGRN